jgi:hypothetical protein
VKDMHLLILALLPGLNFGNRTATGAGSEVIKM